MDFPTTVLNIYRNHLSGVFLFLMKSDTERTNRDRPRIARGIMTLAIVISGIAFIWFGFQTVLGTPTPFYVVSSGSMIPALQIGDIIVVQDTNLSDGVVEGDVIVFDRPTDKEVVVVHRIVDIVDDAPQRALRTKGDNNRLVDGWLVTEEYFLGKVIFTVPKIGYLSRILNPPLNFIFVIIILAVIFLSEAFPSKEKPKIKEISY